LSLPAGTRLGPYEILSPLGAGGMGEVYRARDKKLDRDVAIKVLPQSVAAEPDTLARFEREAKAVAALSHPNILSIFDFGNQDGIAYAVMELLEGETVRGKLDAGLISAAFQGFLSGTIQRPDACSPSSDATGASRASPAEPRAQLTSLRR
jgi:serine/threonine protein kinase